MSGYLEEVIGFLEGEVGDCIGSVIRSDIDQAGELQAGCGEKLRKLAAAHWLINKSRDDFFRNLKLAAACRLEFVKKSGSLEHYFYSINSVESIENAIIGGGETLVNELAKASSASSHQQGHVTDWAYQHLLGSILLEDRFSLSDSEVLTMLTDNPHSIYLHPVACLKAVTVGDEAAFEATFRSWYQSANVKAPDEEELAEADQNESQSGPLIGQLDNSIFFAGLAVCSLAKRGNIKIDSLLMKECGLEQLVRETW